MRPVAAAKSKGMLFKGAMIRRFLDESKWQTRRLIFKDDPGHHMPWFRGRAHWQAGDELLTCPCPVGTIIWVKETWATTSRYDHLRPSRLTFSSGPWYYAADGDEEHGRGKLRSGIFMPRWASRVSRVVANVRAERLQDISRQDAIAEGLSRLTKDNGQTCKWGIPDRDGLPGNHDLGWHWSEWEVDPREAYKKLWCEINGPDSWDLNPWVWVYELGLAEKGGPL